MAIQTQNINLNIVPGGIIPVMHVSQYDYGRSLSFTIYDGNSTADLPEDCTATIEGTKSDGTGFEYDCTITDNVVTVDCTVQMTVYAEAVDCKINFYYDDVRIGTALFILDVEKAGIDDDTSISETELPTIIALALEQEEQSEAWAAGTIDGEAVTSDDEQYHNNSKYWNEQSEAWAIGTIDGEAVTSDDEQYQNNSKYWSEQAEETYNQTLTLLELPVFTVDFDTGELVYDSGEMFDFSINTTTGELEWEVVA